MPKETTLQPHFEDVQAHYDLSDDFFGLFQGPTRKYSCAFFGGPRMTLSEAQIANIDQHLDRLELRPGMTLFVGGCSWQRSGLAVGSPRPNVGGGAT
jgi:cyclopropane-fatty-acyl-phospholipid synthase